MSQTASNLLIGLVVNALWLGIVLTAGHSYGLFKRNSCATYWRSERGNRQLYATVSVVPTVASTKEYRRPATGLGELQAYAAVVESLYAARKSKVLHSVSLANALPAGALSASVVSIGGSRLNSVTELYLGCLELEFEVKDVAPKHIIDTRSGDVFESQQRGGQIVVDYGVLTSIRNPFAPKRRVHVLQGAHTFGTAACGLILAPEHIGSLLTATKGLRGRDWQAVVRGVVHGTEVFPEVVQVREVKVLGAPYQR